MAVGMSLAEVVVSGVRVGAYTVRRLHPSEYWRLATVAEGPFAGKAPIPGDHLCVTIVEETATGALAAYWPAMGMPHADNLYVAPDLRQHPKVELAFLGAYVEMLREQQVTDIYAMIDEDRPENVAMAHALGLERVPGALYKGRIA